MHDVEGNLGMFLKVPQPGDSNVLAKLLSLSQRPAK